MAVKLTNNASATLASSITNSDTSISVTTGQGALFPSLTAGEYFFATLVDSSNNLEIIKVTARTADALTAVRAQDNTAARAYTAGDKLELRPVAAVFSEFVQLTGDQTIAGVKTFSSAIVANLTGNVTGNVTGNLTGNVTGNVTGDVSGNAGTVTNGVYTTGDQTIAGTKTFSGTILLNNSQYIRTKDSGGTTRDVFVVSGDNTTNFFNSGNHLVRILNQAGTTTLVTLTDTAGNLTATGNVTAYSDERLKTNWRPVQDNFIERLAAVKNGIYERTDAGTTQVGVSAQSLEQVIPEAILKDEQGIYSVAYGNAALVSVVELAKEVVSLRKRIEALEGKA